MPLIDSIPALVKVGAAFVLIVGLNRFRIHLGLALFAGAALLGLSMGMSPSGLGSAMAGSLLDPGIAALLLIVAVILALSRIMAESGQLERIVTSFTRLTNDSRMAAMVMPALIGLLPMPGGALFSAPMVETACGEEPVRAEIKTAVNYWFRHMWEYWWPLYPGVVLAVSLLGVEAWAFMLVQAPLTLLTLGAGLLFLPRLLPRTDGHRSRDRETGKGAAGAFLREVRPITLVILALPAVWAVEKLTGIAAPRLTAVFLGLGLCLTWVIVQNRPSAGQVIRSVTNRSSLLLLFLICGIMAFKGVLTESQAVVRIQAELVHYGIPSLVVLMVVPFLAGFITGIAVGFVGASFPLVVALLAGHTGLDYLAHASLAYAFGYMGMMLSPVHVCFLVTRDYFHSSLGGSYRYLIGPAALVMASSLVYFALLMMLA
jgi:integral membrane protein (TIGR00529 family)